MPTPYITIDDFSVGVTKDITRNTAFNTMFACDIYRDPGVFRSSKRTIAAGDDSIFDTNSEYIKAFEIHSHVTTGAQIYGRGNRTRVYRLNLADVWVSDFDTSFTTGFGVKSIQSFGESLYFAGGTLLDGSSLGRLNGNPAVPANWTTAYKTFPVSAGVGFVNAIQSFSGSLYVARGRNVGKLDADEITWDDSSLVLQEFAKIIDMTVWNNFLVISFGLGEKNNTPIIKKTGFVAFWDGISQFPSDIIPTDGVLTSMIDYNNRLTGFVDGRMYMFNGSDFQVQKQLQGKQFDDTDAVFPGDYLKITGSVLYRENLLFVQGNTRVSNPNPSVKGGVWTFGRTSVQFPFSMAHKLVARTGEYGQNDGLLTGGITVVAGNASGGSQFENIYFSYKDEAQAPGVYNVDRIELNEGYPSETYLVTVPYEVSANEAGRLVKGVKVEFAESMNISSNINKVVVSYRIDDDIDNDDDTTNWTVLGDIDNDPNANNNMKEILYGIYKKPFKIQFKFELVANGIGADQTIGITRIHVY